MIYKTLLLFVFTSLGQAEARETEKKILIDDEEEHSAPVNSNCHIDIERTNSLGYLILQKIHTTASDREECNRKSQPHKINFSADEITKTEVRAFYDEK